MVAKMILVTAKLETKFALGLGFGLVELKFNCGEN